MPTPEPTPAQPTPTSRNTSGDDNLDQPPASQFWADLNDRLKDPEFRRAYVAAALEIEATDRAANQPPAMRAEDVPLDLHRLAVQAINANDELPDGDRDRTPHHILAAVLPVYREQVEREVRAKVAEELRRAASGRTEYANGAPEGAREHLLVQVDTFNTAAKIADGHLQVMRSVLPVRMWTEAEERAARGEV